MTDTLVEQVNDNANNGLPEKSTPKKGFGDSAPKKRQGAFWLCSLAALLLVLLVFAGSLVHNINKVSLFEQAILDNVDLNGLGIGEENAMSFADATIAYLQGDTDVWAPVIRMGNQVMPIPESFTAHMATVRGWVSSAQTVFLVGLVLVLVLLYWAMSGTRSSRASSFSIGGYYLGACVPLAVLAGLIGWACFNFDGMWAWLHVNFIPDGIFNAGEPIMQLFPTSLFMSYLQPVGLTFGILLAVVLLLPLILSPMSKRLAALQPGVRPKGQKPLR